MNQCFKKTARLGFISAAILGSLPFPAQAQTFRSVQNARQEAVVSGQNNRAYQVINQTSDVEVSKDSVQSVSAQSTASSSASVRGNNNLVIQRIRQVNRVQRK